MESRVFPFDEHRVLPAPYAMTQRDPESRHGLPAESQGHPAAPPFVHPDNDEWSTHQPMIPMVNEEYDLSAEAPFGGSKCFGTINEAENQ